MSSPALQHAELLKALDRLRHEIDLHVLYGEHGAWDVLKALCGEPAAGIGMYGVLERHRPVGGESDDIAWCRCCLDPWLDCMETEVVEGVLVAAGVMV